VQLQNESSSVEFSAPYSVLAPIYDQMMSHVNYGRWADYIEAIIHKTGAEVDCVLDVGCGTGSFLREMRQRHWKVAGIDPSAQMLKVARKRLPNVPFREDGLPQLATVAPGEFAVITCLFDTMNYLPEISLVSAALDSVYQKLASPGLFIFDLVGEENCKHYFNNYTENDVISEELAYSRFCHYDRKNKIQTNEIQMFTADGVFEEIHHQKIFSYREVEKLIRRKKEFGIFGIFEGFSFRPVRNRSGRAHFVLQKRSDDDSTV